MAKEYYWEHTTMVELTGKGFENVAYYPRETIYPFDKTKPIEVIVIKSPHGSFHGHLCFLPKTKLLLAYGSKQASLLAEARIKYRLCERAILNFEARYDYLIKERQKYKHHDDYIEQIDKKLRFKK
jgi:hypothetical protein